MQTFKEKALKSSCRYRCITGVIRLVAGRRDGTASCSGMNVLSLVARTSERQELHNSYWSMFIDSKCSFSTWEEGQGDWASFCFDFHFKAEMLPCIPASQEGENPSPAPTSWPPSLLCNVRGWGRVRAVCDPPAWAAPCRGSRAL